MYGSSLYDFSMEELNDGSKRQKEEHIDARLTAEAKQQIDQAAALQGRSTSDFMVQAALKEASQVIEQQRIIRLTVDESIALAELMASEPQINKASVEAMRRHNEIIVSLACERRQSCPWSSCLGPKITMPRSSLHTRYSADIYCKPQS